VGGIDRRRRRHRLQEKGIGHERRISVPLEEPLVLRQRQRAHPLEERVCDCSSSRDAGGRLEGEEQAEQVGGARVEVGRAERRSDVVRPQPTV
jgi:hypothetical protein